MLTIKILFTINSLKKEKLFRQNSIYNSIHLKNKNIYVWLEKIHLIKKIYIITINMDWNFDEMKISKWS